MLKFNLFHELESYKSRVLSFLEQDEVVNNLILGLLLTVTEQPMVMATVTRNEQLVLCLLQTSLKQIVLSKTDLSTHEVVEVAKHLDQNVRSIPGLVGEKTITNQLAKELTLLRHYIPSIQMNQRLYKLEKVIKKPLMDGKLVKMTIHNLPLMAEWIYQFSQDINEVISKSDAEIKARVLIEKGIIFGWEVDGEIVSMANAARPTKSNITINFVYTPMEERKKGYATSCVSALSEFMLNSGFRSTSLYTDLANPTSNKIYMEIGYRPILDSLVIHFN